MPEVKLLLAISAFVNLRSSWRVEISGGTANHPVKATKNEIHAKWNARMCGRPKEKRLMLVALLSPSTSMRLENGLIMVNGRKKPNLHRCGDRSVYLCVFVCLLSVLCRQLHTLERLAFIQKNLKILVILACAYIRGLLCSPEVHKDDYPYRDGLQTKAMALTPAISDGKLGRV